MNIEELKESYICGNVSYIRKEMQKMTEQEREDFILSLLNSEYYKGVYDVGLLIKRLLL